MKSTKDKISLVAVGITPIQAVAAKPSDVMEILEALTFLLEGPWWTRFRPDWQGIPGAWMLTIGLQPKSPHDDAGFEIEKMCKYLRSRSAPRLRKILIDVRPRISESALENAKTTLRAIQDTMYWIPDSDGPGGTGDRIYLFVWDSSTYNQEQIQNRLLEILFGDA